MDSTGLSSADVKKAGICQLRDAWTESVPATSKFGEEGMIKRPVKPPPTLAKHRENYLSSQVEAGRGTELPEAGVSYNPTAESHQRLLELAVEEEEERLRQETADEERIKALGEVVNARRTATALEREYADGMIVGPGEVDNASVVDEEEEERTVKPTRRKTQAGRNKAIRLREASRLASLEARQKKTLRSISAVPALKSTLEKREKGLVEAERLAKLAKRERERLGLEGGEKVGKWRVGKGSVAVQLGEDLAETLRQVKVGRPLPWVVREDAEDCMV